MRERVCIVIVLLLLACLPLSPQTAEQQKHPKFPDLVRCYQEYQVAYDKGDNDATLALARKTLDLCIEICGDEDPTTALFYNNLASAYDKKGEYQTAIGLYEKALAIGRKTLGEDHAYMADYNSNLGLSYHRNGQNDKAIECFEKALGIYIKNSGEESRFTARQYTNLGMAYNSRGEYDRAIGYYEKSLAIGRKTLGDDDPEIATNYNNLGSAYDSKGEYDKAIGYFEKALAIDIRALGEWHRDVAIRYNNLGTAYDNRGDHDKAIACFEKALAIGRKALGDDHPDLATRYNNLGSAYDNKGEYDKAIGYYEKALAIGRKTLGEDHPDMATRYSNLGSAYDRKGEFDKAIGYYEKALAIGRKTLGEDHPDMGTWYNNLASSYDAKGDHETAIGLYEKAIAIFKAAGERQSTITTSRNLGRLHLLQNNPARAHAAFAEAIAVIESARGQTGAGRVAFMARNIVNYYYSLKSSALMHDNAAIFATAESMRSRGFLDRLSLASALSVEGIAPADRERMLALNDRIESLATQRSEAIIKSTEGQGSQKTVELTLELETAEKEFAELDARFMENERYRNLRRPAIATLVDAQRLAGDGAILEYVIWEVKDRASNENSHKQSFCIVITAQGMKLVELDRDFDYTGAIENYRATLTGGAQTRGVALDAPDADAPAAPQDRDALAALLYEKLITPVQKELAGITNLVIVPDGALAFLPFDALRNNAAAPYLCETWAVTMSPSVSVLCMVQGRTFRKDRQAMLAFGGAVYEKGTGTSRGKGAGHTMLRLTSKTQEYYATRGAKEGAGSYFAGLGDAWFNLPGTSEEVAALASRVYGGTGAVIVQGRAVSEKGIKERSRTNKLAAYMSVHFACHGYYDAAYPAYSSVVLSEVSGELRQESTEDGYLSVEEVALLKFNADIVNLSACETGLGTLTRGDGVVGLTRAFQVAGANRVGVTLWQVDDEATKEFMVRVYTKAVKQGKSFRAAYVETKREFVRSQQYRDPYFWSTFVLYGE